MKLLLEYLEDEADDLMATIEDGDEIDDDLRFVDTYLPTTDESESWETFEYGEDFIIK